MGTVIESYTHNLIEKNTLFEQDYCSPPVKFPYFFLRWVLGINNIISYAT